MNDGAMPLAAALHILAQHRLLRSGQWKQARWATGTRTLLLAVVLASAVQPAAGITGPGVQSPTLLRVDTVSQGPSPGADAVETRASVTVLLARFDKEMYPTGPSAFRLRQAGADGTFGLASCDATTGDDVEFAIDAVRWLEGGSEAAIAVGAGASLPAGHWRLIACPELQDVAGYPLAGAPIASDFIALVDNRLRNPNFDGWPAAGLEQWDVYVSDEASVEHDPSDAGDAPISGSADAGALLGGSAELSQCIPAEPVNELEVGLRAAIVEDASVSAVLRFLDGPDCTGRYVDIHVSRDAVAGDTGGEWIQWSGLPVEVPEGTRSIDVSFSMTIRGMPPYGVRLDDVVLVERSLRIFQSGMESF